MIMSENDLNQQMAELETQLAFQEDHLQKLNDVMVDQQKRIDALEAGLRHYEKRLREIQEGAGGESAIESETPPHY